MSAAAWTGLGRILPAACLISLVLCSFVLPFSLLLMWHHLWSHSCEGRRSIKKRKRFTYMFKNKYIEKPLCRLLLFFLQFFFHQCCLSFFNLLVFRPRAATLSLSAMTDRLFTNLFFCLFYICKFGEKKSSGLLGKKEIRLPLFWFNAFTPNIHTHTHTHTNTHTQTQTHTHSFLS